MLQWMVVDDFLNCQQSYNCILLFSTLISNFHTRYKSADAPVHEFYIHRYHVIADLLFFLVWDFVFIYKHIFFLYYFILERGDKHTSRESHLFVLFYFILASFYSIAYEHIYFSLLKLQASQLNEAKRNTKQ